MPSTSNFPWSDLVCSRVDSGVAYWPCFAYATADRAPNIPSPFCQSDAEVFSR